MLEKSNVQSFCLLTFHWPGDKCPTVDMSNALMRIFFLIGVLPFVAPLLPFAVVSAMMFLFWDFSTYLGYHVTTTLSHGYYTSMRTINARNHQRLPFLFNVSALLSTSTSSITLQYSQSKQPRFGAPHLPISLVGEAFDMQGAHCAILITMSEHILATLDACIVTVRRFGIQGGAMRPSLGFPKWDDGCTYDTMHAT